MFHLHHCLLIILSLTIGAILSLPAVNPVYFRLMNLFPFHVFYANIFYPYASDLMKTGIESNPPLE